MYKIYLLESNHKGIDGKNVVNGDGDETRFVVETLSMSHAVADAHAP